MLAKQSLVLFFVLRDSLLCHFYLTIVDFRVAGFYVYLLNVYIVIIIKTGLSSEAMPGRNSIASAASSIPYSLPSM